MKKSTMFSIFFLLPHMVANAQEEYTWYDRAKDSYIETQVELNGLFSVCQSISSSAEWAAGQTKEGGSFDSIMQNEMVSFQWVHPLVENLEFWHAKGAKIAIDLSKRGIENNVISEKIKRDCIRGEGEFFDLHDAIISRPLAPSPSEREVLNYACKAYGYFVWQIGVARDKFDQPLWYSLERRTSTKNSVVSLPRQKILVESVYKNKELNAEEIRDLVESSCLNKIGFFK